MHSNNLGNIGAIGNIENHQRDIDALRYRTCDRCIADDLYKIGDR